MIWKVLQNECGSAPSSEAEWEGIKQAVSTSLEFSTLCWLVCFMSCNCDVCAFTVSLSQTFL